ncbi:MAG TPA: hypothetical protein VMB85_22790 [Bryobacteraceae bacterium]|nr:hypothetical protein [Bryobacteraceae bacterium]
MRKISLVPFALILLLQAPPARPADEGIPVKITATAEPMQDNEVALIGPNQVTAYQNREQVTVSSWVPARGPNAALELFVLIDDASQTTHLGSQLNEIRQFVQSQPPTTLTGVAYMQNGIARVLQNPTRDHALAAKTIRLPFGQITAGASPYISLSDLIKRWPASGARREVVMISSGVDPLGGPPPVDPYLQSAIRDAQRAGIIVYSIYTPHAGHFGRGFWMINWGQNYLSELSEETGGDMFGFGFIPPVSFAPFFKEIMLRLENQYLTTLLMHPGKGAGFQPLRLISKAPNAEIVSQKQVYIPLGG